LVFAKPFKEQKKTPWPQRPSDLAELTQLMSALKGERVGFVLATFTDWKQRVAGWRLSCKKAEVDEILRPHI